MTHQLEVLLPPGPKPVVKTCSSERISGRSTYCQGRPVDSLYLLRETTNLMAGGHSSILPKQLASINVQGLSQPA